jgi:hypothetical protein
MNFQLLNESDWNNQNVNSLKPIDIILGFWDLIENQAAKPVDGRVAARQKSRFASDRDTETGLFLSWTQATPVGSKAAIRSARRETTQFNQDGVNVGWNCDQANY